ncbi:MAG: hypothetical protein AAFP03_05890 [Cyanobacteria bacterium J06598_3]
MVALKSRPIAKINQNRWDLEAVITQDHVVEQRYFDEAPQDVVDNFRKLLSRDVFSEGDSQRFYAYVKTRQGEMSDAFLAMLEKWLADELKHYEGLRRVYHGIAGVSYDTMDQLFAERTHAIEPIGLLLEDEFSMLLALMFDELGSVYSYRRDLREYYRHFSPAVKKMGHHLVKDEGMHFSNAAELLLCHHTHRFAEIPMLLEKISQLEKSLTTYHKTFFLDHAQEKHRFPSEFNQVIIQVILARLGLGDRPHQSVIRALWQWVPEGCTLVPV